MACYLKTNILLCAFMVKPISGGGFTSRTKSCLESKCWSLNQRWNSWSFIRVWTWLSFQSQQKSTEKAHDRPASRQNSASHTQPLHRLSSLIMKGLSCNCWETKGPCVTVHREDEAIVVTRGLGALIVEPGWDNPVFTVRRCSPPPPMRRKKNQPFSLRARRASKNTTRPCYRIVVQVVLRKACFTQWHTHCERTSVP